MAYRFFCALFVSVNMGCLAAAVFADNPETTEGKSATFDAMNIVDSTALRSSTPESKNISTPPPVSAVEPHTDQAQAPTLTSNNSSTPAATPSRLAERLPASPQGVTPRSQLTTVMAGLMGIIVLILALAWLFKRFGQGGFLQNNHMRVVSTLPLGTREKAILVEVGEQQLLLGVTPTSINTLHVLNEPVRSEREKSSLPVLNGTEKNSDFGRKLMNILQQKPREEQTSKTGRPHDHHSKN